MEEGLDFQTEMEWVKFLNWNRGNRQVLVRITVFEDGDDTVGFPIT